MTMYNISNLCLKYLGFSFLLLQLNAMVLAAEEEKFMSFGGSPFPGYAREHFNCKVQSLAHEMQYIVKGYQDRILEIQAAIAAFESGNIEEADQLYGMPLCKKRVSGAEMSIDAFRNTVKNLDKYKQDLWSLIGGYSVSDFDDRIIMHFADKLLSRQMSHLDRLLNVHDSIAQKDCDSREFWTVRDPALQEIQNFLPMGSHWSHVTARASLFLNLQDRILKLLYSVLSQNNKQKLDLPFRALVAQELSFRPYHQKNRRVFEEYVHYWYNLSLNKMLSADDSLGKFLQQDSPCLPLNGDGFVLPALDGSIVAISPAESVFTLVHRATSELQEAIEDQGPEGLWESMSQKERETQMTLKVKPYANALFNIIALWGGKKRYDMMTGIKTSRACMAAIKNLSISLRSFQDATNIVNKMNATQRGKHLQAQRKLLQSLQDGGFRSSPVGPKGSQKKLNPPVAPPPSHQLELDAKKIADDKRKKIELEAAKREEEEVRKERQLAQNRELSREKALAKATSQASESHDEALAPLRVEPSLIHRLSLPPGDNLIDYQSLIKKKNPLGKFLNIIVGALAGDRECGQMKLTGRGIQNALDNITAQNYGIGFTPSPGEGSRFTITHPRLAIPFVVHLHLDVRSVDFKKEYWDNLFYPILCNVPEDLVKTLKERQVIINE